LSTSSSSRPTSAASAQAQQKPFQVRTKKDENEQLAQLFADREGGQDTFGNVGALRYGYTDAGRNVLLQQQPTGAAHNPFAKQQQQAQNERPFFDI